MTKAECAGAIDERGGEEGGRGMVNAHFAPTSAYHIRIPVTYECHDLAHSRAAGGAGCGGATCHTGAPSRLPFSCLVNGTAGAAEPSAC